MEISENDLWILSYYRESELAGGLVMGRLARETDDDDLRVHLTEHCAEEANHAWLWTQTILKVGGTPKSRRRDVSDALLRRDRHADEPPRDPHPHAGVRATRHPPLPRAPQVAEHASRGDRDAPADDRGRSRPHQLGEGPPRSLRGGEGRGARGRDDASVHRSRSARVRGRDALPRQPASAARPLVPRGAVTRIRPRPRPPIPIAEVRRLVAKSLGVSDDTILEASSLRDLGVNSLDLVVLVMAIEERFRIEFDPTDLERLRTFGDLARRVEELNGGR